ncbi:hypothetical protein HZS_3327 [Henneguya salminicola]|nr:hypothetical protein HZS_3327 [Henneguya salminicola]
MCLSKILIACTYHLDFNVNNSISFLADERLDFYDFCLLIETQPSSMSTDKLDLYSIFNCFVTQDDDKIQTKTLISALDYTFGQDLSPQEFEQFKKFTKLNDPTSLISMAGIDVYGIITLRWIIRANFYEIFVRLESLILRVSFMAGVTVSQLANGNYKVYTTI